MIILIFIGGNLVATPEQEKAHHLDLAAAYRKSTSTVNKALADAHQKAADRIVLTPPVQPPVVTPPVVGSWPKDSTANPTGPKKLMTAVAGDLITNTDGQIIDAKNISGKIIVKHNNVKITNFVTTGVWKDSGKTGLIMEDGKIDGQNVVEDAVRWGDYTARRVEVTRTTDAFKAQGNVLIEDCWIHDLNFQTGAGTGAGNFSHNDGAQTSVGNNTVVRRTRLENMRGNAGLYTQPDQGTISNVTYDSNYLTNVGNYMIYVKESVTKPENGLPNNVIITNNIFGKHPDYLDPTWGEMKAEVRATNLVWKDNKNEAGKLVELDAWGKGITV